jgi:multiple sugar transport system permease protein
MITRKHDKITIFLYLTPSIIVFALFTYYVLGYTFYLSATSWNFITPVKRFIGLTNYSRIFQDPAFWNVLKNTFVFSIGNVVISMIMGLGLALLLKTPFFGRGFFRTLFYFPNVTTASAVAILWIWIFDPSFGLINYLLSLVGINGPRWLMDPKWAMPAVITLAVWRAMGYNMVIYISGLTSISKELYEAAKIDGASAWQQTRFITIPLLSPSTLFLLMTNFIGALQVFDVIQVMTNGGPVGATSVMNLHIYAKAFNEFRAGYASALSIVLFLIILTITILQNYAAKRWVHYGD